MATKRCLSSLVGWRWLISLVLIFATTSCFVVMTDWVDNEPPPYIEHTSSKTLVTSGAEKYTVSYSHEVPLTKLSESRKRVFQIANALTNISSKDGLKYMQHDWSLGTDIENLAKGIDCSRAIWFVFTRAGVRFNNSNRYLATSQMIGPESKMSQMFLPCPSDDDLMIGDVLVYQDAERRQGHVVMVADRDRKIAWGSHGWDGSNTALTSEQVGVEYQQIRGGRTWKNWDRKTMELKACWRHKLFVAESSAEIR